MITLPNLAAFLIGMLVVYVLFRAIGVFVIVICISLCFSADASVTFINDTPNIGIGTNSVQILVETTGGDFYVPAGGSLTVNLQPQDIGSVFDVSIYDFATFVEHTAVWESNLSGIPFQLVDGAVYSIIYYPPSDTYYVDEYDQSVFPELPDVWPSCAAGFGFGLTVCGFGWVFRLVKKTADAH